MQFSIAPKFKIQQLRRYSIKPWKICNYVGLRFRCTEIYAYITYISTNLILCEQRIIR
jgi:hypothetical protein